MPIGADKFSELPESVNELVADRAIRHALYLERYKTHLVADLLSRFNRNLEPALVAKIQRSLERVTGTSKQLQAIFKYNGKLVREEYSVMEAKLYDHMRDFTTVESAWIIKTLETMMPIAWDFVAPNANLLKAMVTRQPMEGALVKDWFAKLSKDTAFAINRQIQLGMVEGEGIEAIVRRIKGTRAANYTDGILNASRSNLQSVVRTSVSTIAHASRDEVYRANTNVIKGVQIMATLDARTCVRCMNWDGNVYGVDEVPAVPGHYSCRCTTVPVLRSWKEMGVQAAEAPAGTRASMNGQVADAMTYPAWLKKQSAEVQNEALGMARAKLFRSGQLKLNQFIDRQNRRLTLKELAAKLS